MRSGQALAQRAWTSSGNGALFTHRLSGSPSIQSGTSSQPFNRQFASASFQRPQRCPKSLVPRAHTLTTGFRCRRTLADPRIARVFATSRVLQEERSGVPATRPQSYRDEVGGKSGDPEDLEAGDDGFGRTEKASQAAQLNLSAKLSKDGKMADQGTFSEVWRLLKIAWPENKPLGIAFAFLLISSSVTMAIPFSIGKILDIATGKGAEGAESGAESGAAPDLLFGFSTETFYLGLLSILACGAAANYGRIIILRIVGERIVTRLRSTLFKRTMVQNAEFFDANRVGDLISRLGSDTIIVGKSITQNLSDGLRAFVSGAAGMSMMLYVSAKLTGILALMFPPVAIGAFFYGRAIRNLSRKIQSNVGTLTKIAEERLGNVRTSQSFVGEVQEVHRYNTQVRKIFDLGKREALISATFFSSTGFMGNMTIMALLYVGGGMVKSGAISIGELSSFLMYTAYAGSSMFGLSGFYSELMKGVGAASRLFELQDREPTISPTKGLPVQSARGPIVFDHVSFSYPTRPAVRIFKDLSFTIKPGTNVAIVAPSGAGKSTVASLLLRFYSPTGGEITIHGVNIGEMNAKQLRRKIGYVGQEPVLFSGSIAENIAYGRPWATKQEIIAAARKANCQFIQDFPDGLETHVGARGTQLSGGQKQRIAIARALLKNPDILILDEATSALDAESETLVNQALAQLLRGDNTTISIAHRLSTIKRSDRIIVIGNDGTIAEEGTFDELSAKQDGAFTKLMEWQMSGGESAAKEERPRHDFDPQISEREELEHDLEDEPEKHAQGAQEGEATQTRKEDVTAPEAVAERVKGGDR